MFGVYFPWETWALFKGVFKRESREYILQYLYYTIGTIISAALSFIVTNNINVTGILGLAIKAVVGILVGNVIYLCINLKNPEFKSIIVDLKRKMVR